MEEKVQQPQGKDVQGQTIIINQPAEKKSNGIGTAGFPFALLGLIFYGVPVLGWILWVLGLIFSLIGVFRTQRGLSIAGLVISFLGLILLIVLLGAIGMAAAAM